MNVALEVKNFLRKLRIKWSFILEKSPWWGGFYEQLIAIVKSSLKKVVGKVLLNFNEMVTVVTEIEGCLNSRPLTYLNEENVYDLLTPNHLIYGRDINTDQITSYDNDVLEINGEQMRRNVSTFRNIKHFLKRFMRNYMLALQERHSYQRRKSNNTCVLKVNDIVLVKSDSAPRLSWQKGKVEKLIYGDDNLVRGADVRVYQDNLGKAIVIRKPLQLPVLLEVTNIIHNDTEINELASEQPRRLASLNADLIWQLSS